MLKLLQCDSKLHQVIRVNKRLHTACGQGTGALQCLSHKTAPSPLTCYVLTYAHVSSADMNPKALEMGFQPQSVNTLQFSFCKDKLNVYKSLVGLNCVCYLQGFVILQN